MRGGLEGGGVRGRGRVLLYWSRFCFGFGWLAKPSLAPFSSGRICIYTHTSL